MTHTQHADGGMSESMQLLDDLLPVLAGTLEIREVFERISTVARTVIPHDMLRLIALTEQEQLLVLAVTDTTVQIADPVPVPESHRSLLTNWDAQVVPDIDADPGERMTPAAEAGYRSLVRVPVRIAGELVAGLGFYSRATNAFGPGEVPIARRMADLVALALAHQRLADQRRRAANLELLEELLKTLTGVLDIRLVFQQVSAIARRVIAHDMVSLPLLSDDREHVIVYAVTGNDVAFPTTVPLPEHNKRMVTEPWDYVIHPDLQTDPAEKALPPGQAGYRGRLIVPIRLQGGFLGALDFFSFTPNCYTKADALVAQRIADHVALALSHQRLAEEAQRAAEARERAGALERRVTVLTAEVDALGGHRRVIGESRAWRHVLKQATQVAGTDTTVLLLGESGTGKEVLARFIHRASARNNGPFVAINCAALPEQLLESELFGHERGAFTGAVTPKPGQLELAASGVLFLDEVSEMSPAAQAKFLRVLQEREFQRLGGTRVLKSNVRVIAATNRDLSAAIARGMFREDLYYRLNVFEIALPPLRDRAEDILALSEAFLQDIGRAFGRPPAGISLETRQILMDYHWPGNVRQLRNTLERAAILCEGGLITSEHLSLPPRTTPPPPVGTSAAVATREAPAAPATTDLNTMERAAIEKALADAKHNKSKAARLLGLTRTQLYVRLRKHGLN